MTAHDLFWIIGLGVLVGVEVWAAIFNRNWVLSRHMWKWFGICKPWKPGENLNWLRALILLGLSLSVSLHFLIRTSSDPIVVFAVGSVWSVVYYYRHEAPKGVILRAKNGEPMTKARWDKCFWRIMEILAQTHPETSQQWRREEAYRRTKRATGIDRPSGWLSAALSMALAYVKSGGHVDFKWSKNIWKGIRGALLMAVGLAVMSFLAAFDTAGEVQAFGVPLPIAKIVALVVAAAIPMVRNFLKFKFGINPGNGR